MLTLEECRHLDPTLKKLSDEELTKVRDALYELGRIIFDDWRSTNFGSNYPVGVLRNFDAEDKI